jgi:hypothetical protein
MNIVQKICKDVGWPGIFQPRLMHMEPSMIGFESCPNTAPDMGKSVFVMVGTTFAVQLLEMH